MEMQLDLLDAITDLLKLKPLFLLGIGLIFLLLFWISRKEHKLPKFKLIFSTILLYYYLCVILKNIVGFPTLNEFFRVSSFGEALFNPNINFIPLIDGLSLEFILNIFCFIPLGFLCPIVSNSYISIKKIALLGLGLSLIIEISQLFTLYRATDVNDLIANALGTSIGCLCFKLIKKLPFLKSHIINNSFFDSRAIKPLPLLIMLLAVGITFIS